MARELLVLAAALMILAATVSTQSGEHAGRATFMTHCAKCHGVNGTPRPIAKAAPNFTDQKWTPTLAQVEQTILAGRGDVMLGFKGRLTPEQIHDVAEYVLSMKKRSQP